MRIVKSGVTLFSASALVTEILWIASSHNNFERPKIKAPLINRNSHDDWMFPKGV